MLIKFIQINIYEGKYLDDLILFLKKEEPDFISMQEVTTGGFNLYFDKQANLFEILKEKLQMHGVFHGDLVLSSDNKSLFGNAVFSKWPIVNRQIVTLCKFRPISLEELSSNKSTVREIIDRHLLDTSVEVQGKTLHILSWHGAWTAPPHDTSLTFKQARIVHDYLKNISSPFVLGGDLNAVMSSKTVKLVETVSSNLMKHASVKMTTNPKVHKIAPRGFLVDYIFSSFDFKLLSVDVPQITVSDHLPVVANLETLFL